jgi:TonB-dependent SusC/RagA subfamily outer membrane receptor
MKLTILFTLIMLVPFSMVSTGQKSGKKIIITGVVTDMKQQAVAGATIFVDNVKTSVTTDDKGFYKVRVNPGAKEILAFSLFLGAAQAPINGQTTVNLTLTGNSSASPGKPARIDEKEEEINVGYGTTKKKDLTMSVGSIDGQHQQFVGYQNIYEMIKGRVPGVEVNGTSIVIRGVSSLNLSSEPLFVVDGVVVPNIDGIDPQIVKSIEVLKGAAASIYGTQGANGVILITLLRGGDDIKRNK